MVDQEANNSRGGKRPGAGRKKADQQTRVICIRVPENYAEKAKIIIERSINHLRTNPMEAKHNFTPEQQTLILNAVAEVVNTHGSGMLFANHFNAMYRDYVQTRIIEANVDGRDLLVYDDDRFVLNTYSEALGDLNEMFKQIDTAK